MPVSIEEAHRVLGLEVGADLDSVKKQYKKLALKTHPDKNPNDPEAGKKFLLISECYKRITDPDSFKDEEDQMPDEEEMEAMFNMMFAEMLGVGGFGGGSSIPFELFEMFEAMMEEDDESDMYMGDPNIFETFLLNEMLNDGRKSNKPIKKSKKKSKNRKKTSSKAESDSDAWETDESGDGQQNQFSNSNMSKKKVSSNSKSSVDVSMDDEEQLLMELMFEQMMGLGGMGNMFMQDNLPKKPKKNISKPSSTSDKFPKPPARWPEKAPSSPTAENEIHLGDYVTVYSKLVPSNEFFISFRMSCFYRYTGRVAFVGPVHYTKGLFVGVITDDPAWGKNNGT